MIERFQGSAGQRRLAETFAAQAMVATVEPAAAALAASAELVELARGQVLIRQGHDDNDVYFILAGVVDVSIHGRAVATRCAGQHVGEMAMIDAGASRSATVTAGDTTVVAKVTEESFAQIADRHPGLWRALARETGQRLRERSKFIHSPNERPIIFIGSSGEALPFASALRDALACPELDTRLWKDGIFGPSRYPMEDLERQLAEADFAVLVATGDDVVESRGASNVAPRDNVVFELGLFMGALTRVRTFLVAPSGVDLKIPTDLVGLTQVRYDDAGATAASEVAGNIRAAVDLHGPR